MKPTPEVNEGGKDDGMGFLFMPEPPRLVGCVDGGALRFPPPPNQHILHTCTDLVDGGEADLGALGESPGVVLHHTLEPSAALERGLGGVPGG